MPLSYLFTGSYLVADAITLLSSPQCLNVAPSDSTRQCWVNTTPSRIDTLVPGYQGPLTANYLLESISIHEINVLFDTNVWLDATNGIPGWIHWFTCLNSSECCGGVNASWETHWNLGNPLLIVSQNLVKKDEGTLRRLPSTVGRGTKCSKLGNVLTRDWITYLLVIFLLWAIALV